MNSRVEAMVVPLERTVSTVRPTGMGTRVLSPRALALARTPKLSVLLAQRTLVKVELLRASTQVRNWREETTGTPRFRQVVTMLSEPWLGLESVCMLAT